MSKQKMFVASDSQVSKNKVLQEATYLSSSEEVFQTYTEARPLSHPDLWLSNNPDLFAGLKRKGSEAKGSRHRLLVVGSRLSRTRKTYLQMYFGSVEQTEDGAVWLPQEELLEAYTADNRDELFISAAVDSEDEAVLLLRGNLERLAVPMDWFTRRDTVHEPDFSDLRLTDYGQTLELGEHDVAADSILYEFAPEVRKRLKDRRLRLDDSFGASLRRLRLHRGLSQSEFPVCGRTIRRIEKGKTGKPRGKTLQRIADTLGVEPEEIETY